MTDQDTTEYSYRFGELRLGGLVTELCTRTGHPADSTLDIRVRDCVYKNFSYTG